MATIFGNDESLRRLMGETMQPTYGVKNIRGVQENPSGGSARADSVSVKNYNRAAYKKGDVVVLKKTLSPLDPMHRRNHYATGGNVKKKSRSRYDDGGQVDQYQDQYQDQDQAQPQQQPDLTSSGNKYIDAATTGLGTALDVFGDAVPGMGFIKDNLANAVTRAFGIKSHVLNSPKTAEDYAIERQQQEQMAKRLGSKSAADFATNWWNQHPNGDHGKRFGDVYELNDGTYIKKGTAPAVQKKRAEDQRLSRMNDPINGSWMK